MKIGETERAKVDIGIEWPTVVDDITKANLLRRSKTTGVRVAIAEQIKMDAELLGYRKFPIESRRYFQLKGYSSVGEVVMEAEEKLSKNAQAVVLYDNSDLESLRMDSSGKRLVREFASKRKRVYGPDDPTSIGRDRGRKRYYELYDQLVPKQGLARVATIFRRS